MKEMQVSIITPTFESGDALTKTIRSVLNQTYKSIEYIIVDGNSQDKTVEIAEQYKDAFRKAGINYQVISERDRGIYDALNKGIRLASGMIIGNINAGDWYEKDAVEKAVHFFKRTRCDFMYADLRMIRRDGSSFVKHSKITKIHTSRYWNHPTQFALRSLYLDNPYKVESLHDDFDLLLRIQKGGYKVGVLNEVIANFKMDGVSHERSIRKSMQRAKARYRIYRNNGFSRLYIFECLGIEAAKYMLK